MCRSLLSRLTCIPCRYLESLMPLALYSLMKLAPHHSHLHSSSFPLSLPQLPRCFPAVSSLLTLICLGFIISRVLYSFPDPVFLPLNHFISNNRSPQFLRSRPSFHTSHQTGGSVSRLARPIHLTSYPRRHDFFCFPRQHARRGPSTGRQVEFRQSAEPSADDYGAGWNFHQPDARGGSDSRVCKGAGDQGVGMG